LASSEKEKNRPKNRPTCEISNFLGHNKDLKEQRRLGPSKVPLRDIKNIEIHYRA
jgi:hypothetical protein